MRAHCTGVGLLCAHLKKLQITEAGRPIRILCTKCITRIAEHTHTVVQN